MSTVCTAPLPAMAERATAPVIRRARRIQGRQVILRDATEADADFIVALRTDPAKGAHLSATPDSVAAQRAWLRAYRARQGEAYFVIEDLQGQALGTVRLYDACGRSFAWGSWILAGHAPAQAAIESALMVYHYALDTLGFTAAHFEVQIANERVWAFHERFGAQRVGKDDQQFRYEIDEPAIRAGLTRYGRWLPEGVQVLP